MALEESLEKIRQAMLADSVQSFLPAAQTEAVVAATRKAAAVRSNWDYSPYQQEFAFYQQEEARRQKTAQAEKVK
jgi:hypothetical protein